MTRKATPESLSMPLTDVPGPSVSILIATVMRIGLTTFLGSPILPVTFQYVPAMLAAPDWQHRHAGLMAICAVGEGTAQVLAVASLSSNTDAKHSGWKMIWEVSSASSYLCSTTHILG